MTRKDAETLYAWLQSSYPRNYKGMDPGAIATLLDNLVHVFAHETITDVLDEYKRVYTRQKTEPHPSEILAAIRCGEKHEAARRAAQDPYQTLRNHPKWDEMCRAYGKRACRRAAKLCTETGTMEELTFRLELDMSCREGDFLHRRTT